MHKDSADDIIDMASEENVEFICLMFTDINGMIKNVEVPVSQLEKVLANKITFDGSSIDGFTRIEESDMLLHPDLSTWLIFPWGSEHGKVARLICDIYETDGTPFVGDPRYNLNRILGKMRDKGFTDFNIGPEPEFFLFKLDEKKEAYIRQEYDLGDVSEFDWGHVKLEIGGEPKTIQMAVMTTAKGNYRFAYLYQNQKMESFLDSHVRFFNHVGGVHREIVYDNMKVAVARFVSKTEKEPTEDLLKLSMYYGFKYRFCNARRGNEKGHVERSVEYVRRKVFSKKDSFETLEEANKYLEEELRRLNSKPQKHNENKSAKEFLEEELPHLIELAPSYDISRVVELRVNKYSVISIDENKYSVPDSLVGKFVTAKIYPNNILVYHENELVAEHIRSFGANTWDIKIEHYLNTLKKKPGAIHRSTAMRQMNSKLQDIYTNYYTQNPKDFIDLIELISNEGLEKIEESINELEKINPLNIDTEKIKLLCNRQEETIEENKYKNTEIEEHSKLILSHYGDLLKNSSVDFDKETLII